MEKQRAATPSRFGKWLSAIASPVSSRASSTTLRDPSKWFIEWVQNLSYNGESTASGENVSPRSALGLSAYFACINIIASDVACLPIDVVRYDGNKRTQVKHPVEALLNETFNAAEDMGAVTGRETLLGHGLGYHGGYAEIVRDGRGVARELYPIDPTTIEARRIGPREITYLVRTPGFKDVYLNPEDVFHIGGLGYDGITSYCIAELARQQIGTGLATLKFAGSYFANNAHAGGVLETSNKLSPNQREGLRESFIKRHQGVENAYNPMILEEGMSYKAISQTPQESQMIETIRNSSEECCRWFRMHPAKLALATSGTLPTDGEWIEVYHVGDTLLPWIVRFENEVRRKLLAPNERGVLFCKHNVRGRLRGNMQSQAAFFREMFGAGTFSQNDILRLLDMSDADGGDRRWIPSTMMPLDLAVEFWQQKVDAGVAGAAAYEVPNDTPQPKGTDEPPDPGNQDKVLRALCDSHADLMTAELWRIFARFERDIERGRSRDVINGHRNTVAQAAIETHIKAFVGVANAIYSVNVDLQECASSAAEQFKSITNQADIGAFCERVIGGIINA